MCSASYLPDKRTATCVTVIYSSAEVQSSSNLDKWPLLLCRLIAGQIVFSQGMEGLFMLSRYICLVL